MDFKGNEVPKYLCRYGSELFLFVCFLVFVFVFFFQLLSYEFGVIVLPLLLLHLVIVRKSMAENMNYSDTTVMGAVKKP